MHFRQFCIAGTAAVFTLLIPLKTFLDPYNRFLGFWDSADALSFVLAILGLTLLYRGLYGLACLLRVERLAAALAVALAAGMTARVAGMAFLSWKMESMRLLLPPAVGLLAGGLAWWLPRVRQAFATLGLILSPLVVILCYQFLTFKTFTAGDPNLPHSAAFPARNATPVYVLIFDAWSYDHTFENRRVSDRLPRLQALARQSYVFHHAISADKDTDFSIPKFLLQTEKELHYREGGHYLADESGTTAAASHDSLFRLAARNGYNTRLLGFYVNYPEIFRDQIHHTILFPHDYKPASLAERTARVYLQAFGELLLPLKHWKLVSAESPLLAHERYDKAAYSEHWKELTHHLVRALLDALALPEKNLFLVAHLPIPHAPFVFNADGSYRGPFQGERMAYDEEGYARHLQYLDRVLGQFIDTLKECGTYDDAALIVTSDHMWKEYRPGYRKARKRHVPLFIKLPGQNDEVDIGHPVNLTRLAPVIDALMKGQDAHGPVQQLGAE